MELTKLTAVQLRKAAEIKEQIDALTEDFNAILNKTPVNGLAFDAPAIPTVIRRRRMRPEVKKRLAQIARARWRKAKRAGRTTL